MRQADLRVGAEYAYPTYEPWDGAPTAARVRVVSVDGGGRVTVRVVQAGPKPPTNAWGARPVKRNEERQIATRQIACPWDEWGERAAAIGAEKEARAAARRAWSDEYDRSKADRVLVDPGRTLPGDYDEETVYDDDDAEEREALAKAYIRARGLGPHVTLDQLLPLLVELPVPVLRDILATNAHRRAGTTGTVAATFLRAARLLEIARVALRAWPDGATRGDLPLPGRLLGEADVAFVRAIREEVTASGGELRLPAVPLLPDWVDAAKRAMASDFGWVRLAVGDTGGNMIHSPSCRALNSRGLRHADHLPWWMVMLESRRRVCGRCGGPGVRDLVPMAGFTAAVDVWEARGRDRIERWQQSAFLRLLAATTAARAHSLEPDITLGARIVDVLREDAPGERGWSAYALVHATKWNRHGQEFAALPESEQDAARAMVRDRLSLLETVLPVARRPLPLSVAVDAQALRERHRMLTDLLTDTVPQLDRLLFTLPGAYD